MAGSNSASSKDEFEEWLEFCVEVGRKSIGRHKILRDNSAEVILTNTDVQQSSDTGIGDAALPDREVNFSDANPRHQLELCSNVEEAIDLHDKLLQVRSKLTELKLQESESWLISRSLLDFKIKTLETLLRELNLLIENENKVFQKVYKSFGSKSPKLFVHFSHQRSFCEVISKMVTIINKMDKFCNNLSSIQNTTFGVDLKETEAMKIDLLFHVKSCLNTMTSFRNAMRNWLELVC